MSNGGLLEERKWRLMHEGKPREQKHPRINMAFYDDNLEYVREAAYQNRMSVTKYMNELIKKDRQNQSFSQKTK